MDKNIKILIADDSAFMRKVLKDILAGAGFSKFVECGDGKECLAKYEAEKPGLVLLDIIMPVVDGMEVLKKIGTAVKVLVISAVGQDKIIEETKQHGAVGYIVKPFDRKKVIDEITKVLS
ncbi:response regulator [Patescibacteria group bacterium AH-259-L07]|nr:response regulator [Patescibacteria group bacterium AH-259-L07]